MLTVQNMYDAIASAIQRANKENNVADLMELQQLAGYLMRPADAVGDKATEKQFRILAAHAANHREAIMKRRDDE